MTEYGSNQRRLLQALKDNMGHFCAGPALAVRLGISRTGIWKHIQNLRSQGYAIEAHPKAGYRLIEAPDLLTPEEILPRLKTAAFGRSYHYFRQIGSTNDQALLLAAQGAPHGCLVLAEEQTKGRGRLKRPWLSAAQRGLYLSLLLRNPLPIRDAPQSTLVAALALVKILQQDYELSASIKWPNDILIGQRKVAGVLTEMQSDQDMIRFLVMGVGINVNHGKDELSGPFRYPATSIAIELGTVARRQEVLLAFLHQFERDNERFVREGFGSLLTELEAASSILGRNVTIHCGKETLSGKALGFTPEGALKLHTEGGVEKIIWVGDVTQVEGAF